MKKLIVLTLTFILTACQQTPQVVEWVTTSFENPWQENQLNKVGNELSDNVITIDVQKTLQTIEGFGTCFNVF